MLGCGDGHGVDCDDDNQPMLTLDVTDFGVQPRETTVGEYYACVEAEACSQPGEGDGCHREGSDPDLPANCVNQAQAAAFCAFHEMRLCSEAEWETAARGGCDSWPELGCEEVPQAVWGNEWPSCEQANLAGCGGAPMPVGSTYGGSVAQATDMIGNVAEWTSNYYDPTTYETGGWPATGEAVVVRGGSYGSEHFHASKRTAVEPALQSPEIGIRCCVSN